MKYCQLACVNVCTKSLFGTRLASVLILAKRMRKRLIFFNIAKNMASSLALRDET